MKCKHPGQPKCDPREWWMMARSSAVWASSRGSWPKTWSCSRTCQAHNRFLHSDLHPVRSPGSNDPRACDSNYSFFFYGGRCASEIPYDAGWSAQAQDNIRDYTTRLEQKHEPKAMYIRTVINRVCLLLPSSACYFDTVANIFCAATSYASFHQYRARGLSNKQSASCMSHIGVPTLVPAAKLRNSRAWICECWDKGVCTCGVEGRTTRSTPHCTGSCPRQQQRPSIGTICGD